MWRRLLQCFQKFIGSLDSHPLDPANHDDMMRLTLERNTTDNLRQVISTNRITFRLWRLTAMHLREIGRARQSLPILHHILNPELINHGQVWMRQTMNRAHNMCHVTRRCLGHNDFLSKLKRCSKLTHLCWPCQQICMRKLLLCNIVRQLSPACFVTDWGNLANYDLRFKMYH